MSDHQILIVEDEMIIALDIRTALEQQGYKIAGTVTTAEDAISIAENSAVDLMIVDYRLQGQLNGEEAASAIRTHSNRPIPVIFVSRSGDLELRNRLAASPCAFLKKPIKIEGLMECIQSLLKPKD
jgi:CheY-like chemotaxis protein